MMSPIGLYLAEFVPPVPPPRLTEKHSAGAGAVTRETATEDVAALRLAKARDEGFAAGAAAAEAANAAHVADLETHHLALLEGERQRWAETQGRALASALEQGLAALESRLADALVEVLGPFLAPALRAKAAVELGAVIEALLADGNEPAIAVAGPADLVGVLQQSFAGRAGLTFTAAETPEVKILAGEAAIASRLEAWTRVLQPERGDER